MDELFGLPAHPLLVHLPVVLVPLAAIGVLLMAVRRSLVPTVGLFVAAVAGLGAIGAVLAVESGEALEDELRSAGETISTSLQDHAEMGDAVPWLAGTFFVLTLAWVLFTRWRAKVGEDRASAVVRRPRMVAVAFLVLAVLSGVVATVSVTWTGHSGARTVWEQTAP